MKPAILFLGIIVVVVLLCATVCLAECGDCNGDGVVGASDALVAAQAALGLIELTPERFLACNVAGIHGDQTVPGAVVDVLDAQAISKFAAGLSGPLSCGEPAECEISLLLSETTSGRIRITAFSPVAVWPTVVYFIYAISDSSDWLPATAIPGSPLTNPGLAGNGQSASFDWDTVADGLGVDGVEKVRVRAVFIHLDAGSGLILRDLIEGRSSTGDTCEIRLQIDNSDPGLTPIGDCDLDGATFTARDGLVAAKIAVGSLSPNARQMVGCDVNRSGYIDTNDVLIILQTAAGLPRLTTAR